MSDKKKKALKIIIPVAAGYLILMAIIAYLVVRLRTGEGLFGRKDADANITAVEQDLPDDTKNEDDADEQTGDAESDETSDAPDDASEADPDEDNNGQDGTSVDKDSIVKASSGLSKERIEFLSGLSIEGDGYEGTKGTGNFNYGEALQKSLLFYELQRSGALPDNTRTNWRGDSCLNDGADNGIDLSGGWFDAGDHVKFNLPMAYTAAMLSWSVYEDADAYKESGQLEYALNNIRYACDYFIKCHPEDEVYYYQVGDAGADHSWWGPAELVELRMDRPSYKVTASAPGSCVTGETAAALASASIIFKDTDKEYSELLLKHAKSLYAFADKYKSDQGYTAANGFYTSSSFYDDLAWAGAWLYLATGDKDYLKKAEEAYKSANQNTTWALCWDDVHLGAAFLLARETGKAAYKDDLSAHLEYWTNGHDGQRINYTQRGLAWLDNWGSLRYATTTAYLASLYSESDLCPESMKDTYWDFAVSQADYALGSSGISFVVGFGKNFPHNPHHRTAHSSYMNDINNPGHERHLLIGALVGGPDASDNYEDSINDFTRNEVACDYNAGFTGLMAKLYSVYHGQTIKNLGAVEVQEDELFSEAQINVPGEDFIEIKAYVYNETGWPARTAKDLELRYFVDLSEVYDAGGTVDDIEVTSNYIQGAKSVGLYVWDEETHIYYVAVSFEDGAVYPGGQESYRKEVQFRIRNTKGTWDNSNDFSYEYLMQNAPILGNKLALYEKGELVYGSEPKAGEHAGASVGNFDIVPGGQNGQSGNGNGQNGQSIPVTTTAKKGDLEISAEYTQSGKNANSLSGNLYIKNTGSGVVSLKDLKIYYYLTNEGGKDLTFSCYYAGIQGDGGKYSGVNGCSGALSGTDKNDSDTLCTISFTDNLGLEKGDTLTISFCINHTDWSTLDTTNDFSADSAENIEIAF